MNLMLQLPDPQHVQSSWAILRLMVCNLRNLVLACCEGRDDFSTRYEDIRFILDEVTDQLHDIVDSIVKKELRIDDEFLSACRRLLESANTIRQNADFFGLGGSQTQSLFRWLMGFVLVDQVLQRQTRTRNYL